MRVVLFDLDGTLLNTGALYAESYRLAFERELDTPPTWEEMLRRRPASERHFLIDWYGEEVGGRIHRGVVAAYAELAPSLLGGFYDGVPEVLATLREAGVPTGIVTGKSGAAFEATRALIDLDGFDVVVVEDHVPAPKPDPRGIQMALAALGARADEAVYVGDTPMDVEAARRAGTLGAAALWGRPLDEHARLAARFDFSPWLLGRPADLLAQLNLGAADAASGDT